MNSRILNSDEKSSWCRLFCLFMCGQWRRNQGSRGLFSFDPPHFSWSISLKVQRADLMCDIIRKVPPFVLSKLWILVADWSMRRSCDTFLIKVWLYLNQGGTVCIHHITTPPWSFGPSYSSAQCPQDRFDIEQKICAPDYWASLNML